MNFYSESSKILTELRNMRQSSIRPVSIPIHMLYGEILRQCHKTTTKVKDELDVIF